MLRKVTSSLSPWLVFLNFFRVFRVFRGESILFLPIDKQAKKLYS
jgi:hypothetical protein